MLSISCKAQQLAYSFCALQEGSKRGVDNKAVRSHSGTDTRTGRPFTCAIGDEAYLAAELLFSPKAFTSDWSASLPEVVDDVIRSCPIDTRRPLYSNIILSVSACATSVIAENCTECLQHELGRCGQASMSRQRCLPLLCFANAPV